MPLEYETLTQSAGNVPVCSFETIRDLIIHIATSSVVISNDSGGGHLGAMLGLKTITITKKPNEFVWRPGFSGSRHVVGPAMTFKWFSGRIWRPFIPIGKIVALIGLPQQPKVHD